MSNITINSRIYVKENFAKSDSGIAHASSITEQKAQQAAEAAAKNAAASVAWDNISTESSLNKIIGSNSRVTTIINTPHATYNQSTSFWDGRCSWSVSSNNSWLQQVHLKFNVNGISANNISSAALTINNGSGGIGENYYICAPKDSTTNISDNIYYHPNNNNLNKNNKQFKIDSFPYQIDITDQLKQCINAGIGVLIITSNLSTPTYTNQISGFNDNSFSINYQETISACTPPTSISNNGSAYIVSNGSISLNLGEGGGEGVNNPITGYRIYWKSGAVPYIGGAEGFYDYYGTNTIITFNTATAGTFPSVRGNTYYFKVCTRGSYAVNNAFLSPISNTYVSIVYNQLPDAPIVSVDKTRVKSTGTIINFTVTPGSDPDTSQTKTLYYATSSTGTKNEFTSPLSQSLNAAATYYFWTYDGYEFSENYTEKSIRLNTPPTITSVTMSAVQTFTPTTEDGYVKNINGSAQITKDPDATLTYSWKLYFNSSESNEISSNKSLTNIDVTQYGITFGTNYKLQLTITDDLGESAGPVRSNQTFGIPAAPTITFYNQWADENVSNTTLGHFDTNVRFKYNTNNTGIDNTNNTGINTIELWNGNTKLKQLNKNNNEDFIDTTLNELARGTSYNLKLKFICNSISTFSNISQVYRAADITPTNITIIPSEGSSIKPYTQQNFNIKFDGYVNGDVDRTLSNIYSIQISGMPMNCDYDLSNQNKVLGTVILNDKTTTNWKTLLGLNNAPNAVYTLPLTIIATNLFGKTFTSNPVNVSLDFVENLTNIGSTKISIKNTSNTFTDILVENNNSPNGGYDSSNRYSLFETQIIKLTISGIQCYADQNADVEFYQNNTKLGVIKINNNNWTAQNNSYIYQLTNPVEFQYTIPKITSDFDVNYSVKVVLANNQSNLYDTDLNICKYCKFDESTINFNIVSINKDDNKLNWGCKDLGSNNLSTKNCQFYTANILSNNFDDYDDHPFGSSFSINSSTGSTSGTIPISDIVYFGAQLTLVSNFLPPDGSGGSVVPFGNKNHIINLTNLYTLYNQVPNLLYGKNFFLLNGTSIGSNSDGMLYLHTTGLRTKIYFGNSDQAEFEITQNGLIIDGGSWS